MGLTQVTYDATAEVCAPKFVLRRESPPRASVTKLLTERAAPCQIVIAISTPYIVVTIGTSLQANKKSHHYKGRYYIPFSL